MARGPTSAVSPGLMYAMVLPLLGVSARTPCSRLSSLIFSWSCGVKRVVFSLRRGQEHPAGLPDPKAEQARGAGGDAERQDRREPGFRSTWARRPRYRPPAPTIGPPPPSGSARPPPGGFRSHAEAGAETCHGPLLRRLRIHGKHLEVEFPARVQVPSSAVRSAKLRCRFPATSRPPQTA